MKKCGFVLIILLSLLCAIWLPAEARQKSLTFEWEQEVPEDFSGWRLYIRQGSSGGGDLSQYTLLTTILYEGTILAVYTSDAMVTSPDNETHEYFFVLTAFDLDGNESGASNEVSAIIDFLPPGAPTRLQIKVK